MKSAFVNLAVTVPSCRIVSNELRLWAAPTPYTFLARLLVIKLLLSARIL